MITEKPCWEHKGVIYYTEAEAQAAEAKWDKLVDTLFIQELERKERALASKDAEIVKLRAEVQKLKEKDTIQQRINEERRAKRDKYTECPSCGRDTSVDIDYDDSESALGYGQDLHTVIQYGECADYACPLQRTGDVSWRGWIPVE